MTLGQRIQHHRMDLNLSQEALGDKLGVSRQAVSKWEADGAVPDTDKLIALSKLFGITLNELLQVEEPQKAEEPGAEAPAQKETPEPVPAKPGINLKLRTTLMAVAIIILGIATLISAMNIATLQKEVASLKEQLAQPAGLDPAAPLVSSFNFIFSSQGTSVFFTLDLLPYQLSENLEVSFTLSSPATSNSRTVSATKKEDGHYTAVLSMAEAIAPLTVTATLSDGMNEYAQALVRITSYRENTYTWETLWDK